MHPLFLPVLLYLATAVVRVAADPSFPVELSLVDPEFPVTIDRPVGAVAGLHTNIYVATETGQLLTTDVQTNITRLLNPGGDDQSFGGICRDSRGGSDSTIYATGRDTGKLFAFNLDGQLLRVYQIAEHGEVYLTGCIQTQDQLLIVNSLADNFFYLPLIDVGEGRGLPAPTDEFEPAVHQGYKMPFEGTWQQDSMAAFNAYGIEWSYKFNTTAIVLNSALGKLYTMTLKTTGVVPNMTEVIVSGSVTSFRGALGILYDSRNENVFYLTMPHLNAIAALEFHGDNPNEAKFIKYLPNALMNGPIALSEYGDSLYAVSYRKRAPSTVYTLVKMPRHIQHAQTGMQYSTDEDGYDPTLPEQRPASEVQDDLREPVITKGWTAPPPIPLDHPDPTVTPVASVSPVPSSTPAPSWSPGRSPVSAEDEAKDDVDDARDPSQVFSGESAVQPMSSPESGSCFPADATALRDDGRHVRMHELQLGDRVLVGTAPDDPQHAVYSTIFAFSHRDRYARAAFIEVTLADTNATLRLTPGHYVHSSRRLVAARVLRARDALRRGDGRQVRITRVRQVMAHGLYNPQTMHGDIVVNGICASTFTMAVAPRCAVALLAPVRAMHAVSRTMGDVVSTWLQAGNPTAIKWLPYGATAL